MDSIYSRLTPNRAAEITRDLVRIPSVNPPGAEREFAEYLAAKMQKLGMKVELFDVTPGRPNVVGSLPGANSNPSLMFNGHLDVVPPGDSSSWSFEPFEGVIEGERVYGRGSADMKGGIAAMLMAVEALKENEVSLNGSLLIAGVMDEESGGLGTQMLMDKGYRTDMAIVGEPTNLDVEIAHKGNVWFEITTKGKAVHSSTVRTKSPKVGLNAIYKMSKIILAFEKYLQDLEKRSNDVVGNPTISVGTIHGGTKTNVVPDTCTITVDRRLLPDESPDQGMAEIDAILSKLRSEDPDIQYESKVFQHKSGVQIDRNERIVKLACEAVKSIRGADPEITGFPAGTDMTYLVRMGKIPTVILGPGRLAQAHNIDEYVETTQVADAAKIYLWLILKILGAT